MGFEAEIDSGMGDGTSELGGQQWLVPHQVNAVACGSVSSVVSVVSVVSPCLFA
jgi:hypothetical protein